MARRSKQDDDLLMEDELAAAFLDDDQAVAAEPMQTHAMQQDDEMVDEEDEWDDDMPGQLAVDVYETKEKLIIKARTAGVNKDELDVNIADNTLSISGTLSSGDEVEAENHHIQECYWGEFSRTITLPVAVKEDTSEAVLKDGVLTISFDKVKQDTVKKILIK